MKAKRGFKGIWIPKEIWLNQELTIMEKVFLVEIDSLDNEDGCFASNAHFADFFGVSKQRCSQIIIGLKEKGYINIDYEKDGKEVKKRIIKVSNKFDRGIKNILEGYQINYEGSNTSFSNTKDNSRASTTASDSIKIKEIVDYLNEKADKGFKHSTESTKKHIRARLNEGFTIEDFKSVIDKKVEEWKEDSKMNQYLRPQTLFATKFESYLNEESEMKKKEQKVASEFQSYDDLLKLLSE